MQSRIRLPLLQHAGDDFAITVEALCLEVRALVFLQVEPGHALEDGRDGGVRRTLAIRVFDAQHEVAVAMAGVEPRIERGARATDVEEARPTRGEAGADFHDVTIGCSRGRWILSEHGALRAALVRREVDLRAGRTEESALLQGTGGWMASQELALWESRAKEMATIAQHLKSIGHDGELAILEAGCGRKWPLDLGDTRYRLTGVDLDADALAHRRDVIRDLHVAVHGDLATVSIEPESFDVVYSSFVLEHVRDADKILENFVRWVRPGGLIILRIPDRDSAYGLVTRCTPFGVHVAYLRYARGYRNAGKPGFAPYPTYYDRGMSRAAIHELARRRSLTVVEERGFAGIPPAFRFIPFLVSLVSRTAWRHDNVTVVLRRNRAAALTGSAAST